MRQTNDYEDQSGGLPLIYMALGVSAFVLMILVLVVTMNQEKKPNPAYTQSLQEEQVVVEEEVTTDSFSNDNVPHQVGGDLVASDLDFWDMYPVEEEIPEPPNAFAIALATAINEANI